MVVEMELGKRMARKGRKGAWSELTILESILLINVNTRVLCGLYKLLCRSFEIERV